MTPASLNHSLRSGILPVFFSLGLFALFSQTVLLRELMVVAWGNELVFGIGLGHWLLGVFSGALTGARFSEKVFRPVHLLILMLLLVNGFSVAGVIWIREMPLISGVMPGAAMAYGPVFLLAALPFIATGFTVGFSFPVAVRVQLSGGLNGENVVDSASFVYIVEGAGAFVGALIFTFLLAGKAGELAILGWGGLVLFLPLLLRAGSTHLMRGIALLMLVANLFLVLPPGRAFSDWAIRQRWKGISSTRLVFSTDSRFQNIAVGKQGGQYQLFEGGRLSLIFPGDSSQKVLAANLMAQHPVPKRVLVLGTVLDGLGTELLRYPVSRLDSVVLDPKVVALLHRLNRKDAELLEKDVRFHEIIGDARRFVRNLASEGKEKYDVVYLNQPAPVSTLLNRFYTVEFFRNVAGILSPGGVVSLKMASTVNYTSGELGAAAKTLVGTVHAVFPQIVISPESPHVLFASSSRNSISADPIVLGKRYRRFKLKPAIPSLIFRSMYPVERTRKLRHALATKPGNIILNSDLIPVLSAEVARLTGWYSGSRMARVMAWLQHAPWLFFLFLLAFRAISLPLAKGRRGRVLLVAGAVGFAAMAMELVVMYTFQSTVGMVYGKVGLLIGLFMTGLPLGAFWSGRFIGKNRFPDSPLFLVKAGLLLMMAVVSVFLLVEWAGIAIPAAGFYLIMAGTGFLTGIVFPAAVAAMTMEGRTLVSVAGWVDAVDHGGGAVGAFLTGGFLVLILGVPITLLFLLAVLGIAAWTSLSKRQD